MKRYSIFIILLAIGFSSCMKSVSINTLRPADITIPNDIQSIVLVDRTAYDRDAVGVIEGILTGEGINEDQDGVMVMFSSLQNSLRVSPRFDVILASEKLRGQNILGSFPDPLDWRQVDQLTRKYNTDALLAIEIFDSNFIVTNGKRKNTRTVEDKDGNKREEEFTEFFAEGVGNTRIGIRLYDAKNRTVIDQDIYTQNKTWEASATSLKEALAQLVSKSQATKYLAQSVGNTYAGKIAPMPVRISRSYYAKPKNNIYLSKGARQASVNQWESAIDTWKTGLRNSNDRKESGRMAYNIAVGYEIIGDLFLAHEWAGRSYVDYGNKKGRSYASQLNNRMITEEILDEQLRLPEPNSEGNNKANSKEQQDKPTIKIKIKDN
ncbi:hypothetical protein MATR_02470 [Marivirga tractuosa]|uniref:Lipoprotein n=1 Tax=Marivirga tractuosa (strain ATCC 23168 / DSM 4126 / NBRC 15989 / NCIMB 1408 / VKM B-1430 / H-43) TaxID=643867 RepID=E4TV23_MARTH|nr:DUF6340 family protein [Marivirga tractuosa]ADR22116.1 hypothetical protein Ftrac_2134 [Marivirga tractuosa DSM 4126]BDD13422.1 hypothetical protein MATR_02470 [Marivirga tractuosa]